MGDIKMGSSDNQMSPAPPSESVRASERAMLARTIGLNDNDNASSDFGRPPCFLLFSLPLSPLLFFPATLVITVRRASNENVNLMGPSNEPIPDPSLLRSIELDQSAHQ